MNRMISWIRAVAALVVASIISAMPASAWAESGSPFPSLNLSGLDSLRLHLGSWSGALGLNYINGTQSVNSAAGSASTTTSNTFRESLSIANSGFYIFSPLLVNGNLSLDLEFDQDKTHSSVSSTATQGKTVGYGFDATFLEEKPYTASVFANRSQTHAVQPFGGRMDGTNDSSGAMLQLRQDSILNDWGYPWVEANLGFHEDHNVNTTTSFGNSQLNDEKSQSLEFRASKGFETADLGFNYQVNNMNNAAFSEGNFQSSVVGTNYSLDFGPNLNRRFDTRSDYLERNGTAPSHKFSNSERLHIDHYENLRTDYLYGITSQASSGINTTEQNGAFSVSHQLYKNLTTSAGVDGSLSKILQGSISTYSAHLGESYTHSLPGKGSFSLNGFGSYSVTSNALSSSSIDVVDEVHNAPNPFGAGVGFLLNHSFAVVTSVVNVRGGGRIPTTVGVDYDVVIENNQTKIVPLATTVLINPGDPLAVSYTYHVDGNLKYATQSSNFGIAVAYPWISASYNHSQSTQTPLSQTASLYLQSSRQDDLQIGLQGILLNMAANASIGLENYKSNNSAYVRSRFSSTLIREVQSNMRIIFGMNSNQSQYTLPDQHTNSALAARSSLNWFTYGGWNNTASIDWSTNKDGATPTQTLVQAIAQSSVTLGLLSLNATVALGEWQSSGSRSTNRSFNISAVRKF